MKFNKIFYNFIFIKYKFLFKIFKNTRKNFLFIINIYHSILNYGNIALNYF